MTLKQLMKDIFRLHCNASRQNGQNAFLNKDNIFYCLTNCFVLNPTIFPKNSQNKLTERIFWKSNYYLLFVYAALSLVR